MAPDKQWMQLIHNRLDDAYIHGVESFLNYTHGQTLKKLNWNTCGELLLDDMNGHRDHGLKHMRRLWNNWRGSLYMKAKSKPLQEVLRDVPEEVDKSDLEWLVKEHFLTKKFKETSMRNAMNRYKLSYG